MEVCCSDGLLFLRSYYLLISGLRKIDSFALVTDQTVSDVCLRNITKTLVESFGHVVSISNYFISNNLDEGITFQTSIKHLSQLSRDSLTLQILLIGTWTSVIQVLSLVQKYQNLCKFHTWWSILSDHVQITSNNSDLSFVRDCQLTLLESIPRVRGYQLRSWSQKPYEDQFEWRDVGTCVIKSDKAVFDLKKRNIFSVTLKDKLKEKYFRINMEKHFPFFIPPNVNRSADGIDVRLIQSLRDALRFNYMIVRPPDGRWGSKENGTWVGMIGQVSHKKADMALGGMTVTEARMEEVSFSTYYTHDRVTFATRAPKEADRTWDIILPFSWKVWVAITGAVFTTSAILCVIEYCFCNFTYVPQFSGQTKPKSLRYTDANYLLYKALVMQDSYETRRSGSRIIIATWWIFTVTVMAGYSGLLVSFMTCPRTEDPLDTINKLVQQLRKKTYQCGTIKDSSDHNIFKGANSEQFQIILKSMESKASNFVKRDLEGLDKCLKENYAYIAGEVTVWAEMANPKLFIFGKDSFRPSGYGIAFRKDFWFAEIFNLWIHKLFEAGILDKWSQSLIEKTQNIQSVDDGSIRPLAFREIQGSIIVHLLGCLAGVVALLFTYIVSYGLKKSRLAWKRSRRKIDVIHKMTHSRSRRFHLNPLIEKTSSKGLQLRSN